MEQFQNRLKKTSKQANKQTNKQTNKQINNQTLERLQVFCSSYFVLYFNCIAERKLTKENPIEAETEIKEIERINDSRKILYYIYINVQVRR